MSDHLPKFAPGTAVTRTASAAIVGGQLLRVTGAGTVGPTSAEAQVFAGVANRDAAAGELLVPQRGGVHVLQAAEALAAGDRIQTGAAGKAALWVAADVPGACIGFAWEAIAADAFGECQIDP